MKVGAVTQGSETVQKQQMTAAESLTRSRQDAQADTTSVAEKKNTPQDEMLSKVKALLDGSYSIRFELDQRYMKTVIRLVDSNSGDVIRQIPPEEFLQMAQILANPKGQFLHTAS